VSPTMRGPFRGASAIALPIVLAVAMTPGECHGLHSHQLLRMVTTCGAC
jgi:hypothetical protein